MQQGGGACLLACLLARPVPDPRPRALIVLPRSPKPRAPLSAVPRAASAPQVGVGVILTLEAREPPTAEVVLPAAAAVLGLPLKNLAGFRVEGWQRRLSLAAAGDGVEDGPARGERGAAQKAAQGWSAEQQQQQRRRRRLGSGTVFFLVRQPLSESGYTDAVQVRDEKEK